MTADQANAVYDVLAAHAGAPEWGRDEFVAAHIAGRCDEFRFVGDLGFGGAFSWTTWQVSARVEDVARFPEMAEIIAATNAALAELRTKVTS